MTLLLIDGNSLTYRAFFALPTDLATASGQVTNAVFGFTSMLVNLLRDQRPTSIAVAFDRPEPTFRHERLPSYKAQRDATPDLLLQQFGLVRQVIDALGITTIELAGFEADDILATMATRARDSQCDVVIVTGDRDAYQLVEDPYVRVLYNKRGVSDYALYDEAGIEERTGVRPDLYLQYAALRGDPSDNLPGVPGVGEKTAAKLINAYGDVDGIYEHLAEQTPKLRQNLAEGEERVRVNCEVMRLLRDAPVTESLEDLAWEGVPDLDEVHRLFDFLEFRSLYDRLIEALGDSVAASAPASSVAVLEAEVLNPDSPSDAVRALGVMAGGKGEHLAIAGGWSGDEGRSTFEGLAIVVEAEVGEVLWLPSALLGDAAVATALDAVLGTRAIAAHAAKPLVRGLRSAGSDVRALAFDTQLAAYLLDPAESRYVLAELLLRYANLEMPVDAAAPEGQLALDASNVDVAKRACRNALAVDRLVGPLGAALDAQGMRRLHDEIEVPLVRVLARMEEAGVGVDVAELTALNDRLRDECALLSERIQTAVGHEFNVNSTVQLRTVLFDELGLTPTKKTKTGYSTDASSLEKLRGEHPVVDDLLRYREVEKLRSTYGEGLLAEVDRRDGRIHATFNQTVARTGRLSSDAPNLHNIPVRTDEGRAFRRAFVPAPGCELLVADYNQVELRCIAHLSQDPGLVAAFARGDDIHTETAARVFGVSPSEVTGEQRAKAKMVSYGLAYGMEAYGLAQRLSVPVGEAAEILDAYFEAFPAVRAYMDRTVAEARERGYTETLFGRRRPIPELSSSNFRLRQAGERQAMNAGIQGLAADIFKVALVRLDGELEARSMQTRLILQVHDEVVLEVPPAERDAAGTLTVEVLRGAADLSVPLEVNLAFGATWADAKA